MRKTACVAVSTILAAAVIVFLGACWRHADLQIRMYVLPIVTQFGVPSSMRTIMLAGGVIAILALILGLRAHPGERSFALFLALLAVVATRSGSYPTSIGGGILGATLSTMALLVALVLAGATAQFVVGAFSFGSEALPQAICYAGMLGIAVASALGLAIAFHTLVPSLGLPALKAVTALALFGVPVLAGLFVWRFYAPYPYVDPVCMFTAAGIAGIAAALFERPMPPPLSGQEVALLVARFLLAMAALLLARLLFMPRIPAHAPPSDDSSA